MDCTVLYKNGSHVTASLVEGGLDDSTDSEFLRVGLEVHEVCLKENLVEKLVHIQALLGRDFLALELSAPILDENIHLGELLANLLRLCSRFVYLVDGEYHWYSGGLGMVDCLDCLRHHGIVSRNDDDCKVCQLCSTGTHGGEGLVSRCIEEGNLPAVAEDHIVGSDVLCDTSGLSCDYIGLADVVEQGSLAMVNVSHHGDNRRPCHEIFLPVRLAVLIDFIGELGSHEFDLVSEFLCYEHESLGIEPLVDGDHKSEVQAGSDDLVDRSVVHQGGEIVDRHELGDFQHLPLCCLLSHLLLRLERGELAFLFSVLCSEIALGLAVVHPCVGLLDLLLDFLLHLLLFGSCHCRFELLVHPLFPAGGFAGRLVLTLVFATVVVLASAVLVLVFVFALALLLAVNLVHIHLLASALVDALALLASLRFELGKVHLAHNLEPGRSSLRLFILA